MTQETQTSEEILYKAFSTVKSTQNARDFLLDLCTPQEISAMAERFLIARLLESGNLSYREISHMTGASTTTVGRVARFLTQENHGGYRRILKAMKTQNLIKDIDNDNNSTSTKPKSRIPARLAKKGKA